MSQRYPFPVPFGWFCVGYPEDFPAGEPKAIYYFDRAPRGVARRARASCTCRTPFCPHLGAHLGHGGTVDGCEIVCPFHGWQFDAEGANTDIPYSRAHQQQGPPAHVPGGRAQRPRRSSGTTPTSDGADVGGAGAPRVQRRPRVVHGHPHRAHRSTPRGRRWPRTASTRPTSGSCTTRPRCRSSRATRPGFPGRVDALVAEVPHAARRDGGPDRHRTSYGPGHVARVASRASSTR